MDVPLHPRFDANRLVYIAYVNGAGRMVVARFTVAARSVQDLEVVFQSNAFSVGSRIAWDDHTHFFVRGAWADSNVPPPGSVSAVGRVRRAA